ncbi:hypothetical protein ACFE04_018343 [Oxalis oulophora]
MEEIKHSHVEVRGLKIHVAEIGSGSKAVLFLHGFPEIWYTWRYQMLAVADAGYRAIAIDCRGYEDSEMPSEPEKGAFMDLVHDVVDLLDKLNIIKVFLVGKDSGAIPAYIVPVFYPERVYGVVTWVYLSCYLAPVLSKTTSFLKEPRRAEADFSRLGVKTVIRNIYILFSKSEIPIADTNQEIMDLVDASTPLPSWFSEEDLSAYAALYEKSGFAFALQVPYRTIGSEDCGVTDPKVTAPALLIMGEKDYCLKFPGMEDYIRSGQVKNFVPDLDIVFFEEGSHFIHEQFPAQMNELIVSFLNKHTP